MDLSYQYTKKRSSFGRQPMFCEQGPELCDSIATSGVEHRAYVLRNPVHQPTQHAPVYSEHYVNTIRAEYSNSGVNHAEGGWPKDVNVLDPEATQRYRRKIEKDDNYIHCVMSLAQGMEHYALQNNAIDMYRTYYGEMGALPAVERSGCRTVNVFRRAGGAAVGSVAWEPEGARFAVTYADLGPTRPADALLWDAESAGRPCARLAPPAPLLDLQYNPRERGVLAGALASGQVAAWDARAGAAPVAVCAPHVAHRDLARSVLFINSKSGREFFSGGPDGVCKWWDLRDLSEPTDEMIVDLVKSSFDVQSAATACGVSVLEYEPTVPTRFMVGTENGLVVGGNRKGKTPMEKLPAKFEAHVGPVRSVERNPSFLKNFLTVGDWTLRVWSEDCRESAVLFSPPHRHKVNAGAWSPTRCSLLLLALGDGSLAAWDLLRRQHAPALLARVARGPLLRLRVHDAGGLVACGGADGNVYMVELSQNLTASDKNDKALMSAIFERESRRERILEARLREIRLRQRQAEDSPAASERELDAALGDRDLAAAGAEYAQLVRREGAAL